MDREVLEHLVERGATIREMGRELAVSATTVRYWLTRHGLRSAAARDRARTAAGRREQQPLAEKECPRHGVTTFRLEGRGYYRCLRCRSERVADRRRRIKAILVGEAGGRCSICGYDRYVGALEFHHVDPGAKRFALAGNGLTRSLEAARKEARKCVLVCSNCHAEVEGGVTEISA